MKTSKPSKTKKVEAVVKDNNDDDSLFGNPNICIDMMKNKEALKANGVELFVSKIIQYKSRHTTSVFVAFSPPENTFYTKDEFLRIVCSTMHNLVHPEMEIPNWITTIEDMKVRKEQHGVESLIIQADWQ